MAGHASSKVKQRFIRQLVVIALGIGLACFGGIRYFADQQSLRYRIDQTLYEGQRLSTLQQSLFRLSRYYSQFIANRDMRSLNGLRLYADKTLEALGTVAQIEESARATIQTAVPEVLSSARETVQFGLKETEGLEGDMRASAHTLEAAVTQISDATLVVPLLMLRRHEKDYLMRGAATYVDQFNNAARALTAQITTQTTIEEPRRQVLAQMVTQYQSRFAKLAQSKDLLQQRRQKTEMTITDALSVVSGLSTDLNARLKTLEDEANSVNTTTQVAVTFGAFIAAAGLLWLLGTVLIGKEFRQLLRNRALARELAKENQRLAREDTLTGLTTRVEFFRRLDARLTQPNAEQTVIGVLDLDNFKSINDLHGHSAGDYVLKTVAKRLNNMLRDEDVIARLGGDEFALLFHGRHSDADILEIGKRLCDVTTETIVYENKALHTGVTIGFARAAADQISASDLYQNADFALYYGKREQKGNPVLFDTHHQELALRRREIEVCLRHGNLQDILYVEFQPILNTETGHVDSFEALARWKSDSIGNVSPGEFIPIAESAGLMYRITPHLFQKALAQAATWDQDVSLSFNLSATDLACSDTITTIIAILSASPVSANRITFEVTETAVLRDLEDTKIALNALRQTGASVALDDFGVGYSSLGQLRNIPLDKLKVDRSFVSNIHNSTENESIVAAILEMCARLGIDCVVEGIETDHEMKKLQEMGITKVQGFLLGRPMAAQDVTAYNASKRGEAERMQRLSA